MKLKLVTLLCFLIVASAHAGMVSNQTDFDAHSLQTDVPVEALVRVMNARGVTSANLQERLERMSSAERAQLHAEFERLPVGAGVDTITGVLIGAGLLVMSDYMGFTDIFPFIKADQKSE